MSRIAILTAVALVVMAGVMPASAVCANARLIGSCVGDCKLFYVGDASTLPSQLTTGVFWGWGGGQPALGVGDDSGDYPSHTAPLAPNDWLKEYTGYGWYLGGSWAAAGVDNCVDNATTPDPKRTVVAISDSQQGKGWFYVLCAGQDTGLNYFYYDMDHILQPIPRPVVTSATKNAGNVTIATSGVTGASLTAGLDMLGTGCDAATVVRGYKLCTSNQNVDLALAAWQCGAETALGASSSATFPCSGAAGGGQMYVGNLLVYESGFTAAFVSEPRQVSCDPSQVADRPTDPRMIKKPVRRGVQTQQ